jgi:DNA invertase Pin-like site-specific DNA recombinase
MVMPMRAISYARFSSQRQSGGSSLERQLTLTREYCEAHGLILDDTLTDEALSAYKGDNTTRGALGVFYDAVHAGQVERGTFLIVEHLDRLSRESPRTALTQFLNLIEAGIKIVTLFDEHLYEAASKSVELDLITAILHMSEAHKSSETKSKRLGEAWTIKRASATPLTKMRPAWLSVRNDASGIVFEPNEGAAVIRRIFREAAAGLGSYQIAARLNKEGVPPLTGNKVHGAKLPNGQPNPKVGQPLSSGWNKSRIIAIIKSDHALGWFQPHKREGKNRVPVGEPIKDYYPAIVTQSIVDAARANVASRTFAGPGSGRRGDLISNLFTGVATCSCGATMFLSHRLAKAGVSGWLRCSVAVRDQMRCGNTAGIHYGKLEEAIIRDFSIIRRIVRASPDADMKTAELAESIAKKTAEADKLKTTLGNMVTDFGNTSQAATFAVLADQMRSMAERHQALLAEIELLEKRAATAKLANRNIDDLVVSYTADRMRSTDPNILRKARSEMAMAIRTLLKKITCTPDRLVKLATLPASEGTMGKFSICYDDSFEAGVWLGADVGDGEGYQEHRFSRLTEFKDTTAFTPVETEFMSTLVAE